jgi:GNAT superfamily N-acetyltransferase
MSGSLAGAFGENVSVSKDEVVRRAATRLTHGDAGELLTLQLAAWVREALTNETLAIPPLHENVDHVRAQLADPALTIWGLREDSRLIATVRTSSIAPATAFVGRLGVVPDRTGEGFGAAMLRLAESRLPDDVDRIELITGIRSFGNHAFYARHGYAIVGRDESEGIVRMAKPR